MRILLVVFFFIFSRLSFAQALPVSDPVLLPSTVAYIANNFAAANSPSFTQLGVVTSSLGQLTALRGVPGLSLIGLSAVALLLWTASDAEKSDNGYQVARISFNRFDYQNLTVSRANRFYQRVLNSSFCNGNVPCYESVPLRLDEFYEADMQVWSNPHSDRSIMQYYARFYKGTVSAFGGYYFNSFDEMCGFYGGEGVGNVGSEVCTGYVIPDYLREQGYTMGQFYSSVEDSSCPIPFKRVDDVDSGALVGRGQAFIDGLVTAFQNAQANGNILCFAENPRALTDNMCDYVNNGGAFYTEDVDCRAYYDGGASGASAILRDGHVISYGDVPETGKTIVHEVYPNFAGNSLGASLSGYRVVVSEETAAGLAETELVVNTAFKVVAAENYEIAGAHISLPETAPATQLTYGIQPSVTNSPAIRYSAPASTNPGSNPDPGTNPGTNPGTSEPMVWPDDYARRGEAGDAADKIIDAFAGDTAGVDLEMPSDTFNSDFFGNTFDSLSAWRLPVHASQCPVGSFSAFGQTYAIDAHCQLVQEHFTVLSSIMVLVYSLFALFLVLKA
jgi:hypothetical protein